MPDEWTSAVRLIALVLFGAFSLAGPAGLSRAVVDRLHAVTVKSLNDPEVRAKYETGGFRVVGSTPEELVATMNADMALTAQLVKSIGIKPD